MSNRYTSTILVIVACIVAFLFLLPLAYMFFTSFKSMGEAMSAYTLLPQNWITDNYTELFRRTQETPMLRWMANTALITAGGTLLVVAVDILAAYSLARLDIPGKKWIISIMIWVLSVPGIVTIFPNFFIMRKFGFIDTFIPLILPYSSSVLGIYMLYNFLRDFPRGLEESALIDGASLLQILIHVIFPAIRPSVITLAFLTFLSIYNDYLWPFLTITQNEMKTMTVGVASLVLGANFVNPGMMMAAALIATLPALLLFLVLNRYIVESTTSSGIKG